MGAGVPFPASRARPRAAPLPLCCMPPAPDLSRSQKQKGGWVGEKTRAPAASALSQAISWYPFPLFSSPFSQKSRRSCALRSMQLLTAHRPAAALKSPRRSRTGSPRTARGRNKRSGISHHVRDASRGEGGRKGRATGERAGPRASSRAGPPSTADLKSDRSHRDPGSPASKPKVRMFGGARGTGSAS